MGPKQIILGLVVDTNKMMVGMTDEYIQQCCDLLNLWDQNRRFFKVSNMQKLVGKRTRLGEGAPWIYKLMSHLYTSLGLALKSNAKLLEKNLKRIPRICQSNHDQDLLGQIVGPLAPRQLRHEAGCKNDQQA
jgi:hypothetical protein